MKHLKLMGWLWLLLGGVWSLLAVLSLIDGAQVETPYPVTLARLAWWQEVIGDILEVTFFLASALCGLALLRRWCWSRAAVWVLGSLWLGFSALLISFASGSFTMRCLWFGPSWAVALYSLVVLCFVKYEPKPVRTA
jgi:hypothetical protein